MDMVITERSIGIGGAVFADRRVCARRRVLKGAVISFNNGYSSFECVVRNQSEDGVTLSMAESFAMPGRFTIRVSDGEPRMAEVRWRSLTQIGVALI